MPHKEYMAKIRSIEVERLFSTGQYENVRVRLGVDIGPRDKVEKVYAEIDEQIVNMVLGKEEIKKADIAKAKKKLEKAGYEVFK